jgi:uncharacterized protein (DUF1697 family)
LVGRESEVVERYLALLRGINVGGKALVKMDELRTAVGALGHRDVRTYIASGNVLFTSTVRPTVELERDLEEALAASLGLPLQVAVRSRGELANLVAAIPDSWRHDRSLRVNIAFLMHGVDANSLVRGLRPRAGVDELVTLPGAIGWSSPRSALTRTGMKSLVAHPDYKRVTVRSLATTLKLAELIGDR